MKVDLGERSYEIKIGSDWLEQMPALLTFVPQTSRTLLITDQNVYRLAGERVLNMLRHAGFQVELAVIPSGETGKTLATAARLYEQMIEFGLDRNSALFALGGGIVGDIAGFVAATYMRGITYVQLPTTLLAQVDSSIGGKTGVNLPQGKNLVGSFYQPALVFIDISFIKTLPEREYLTGLAEVIKYGIIRDQELFCYLENNLTRIQAREKECLLHIVPRCCSIKAGIVARDETETGLRALLNLGHTYGHALEKLTNYDKFTHGEAVGMGMICAARLAHKLDLLSGQDLSRIENLISGLGLPVDYGDLSSTDIIDQMQRDKKNTGGQMLLILPVGIGKSQAYNNISPALAASILKRDSTAKNHLVP